MAQSELPVMYDVAFSDASYFNHVPGGCNVLYRDGHIEFLRYPSQTVAPVSMLYAFAHEV